MKSFRAFVVILLISLTNAIILSEKDLRNKWSENEKFSNEEKDITAVDSEPKFSDDVPHFSDLTNNIIAKERNDIGYDDIAMEDLVRESENGQKGKWLILTTKYRKKHRISNFTGAILDKHDIMGELLLNKAWKRNIMSGVRRGAKKVRLSDPRTGLKTDSTNEVTILSNDATVARMAEQPRQHRYNITCRQVQNYSCSIYVDVKKIVPCWWSSKYQCEITEKELFSATCRRQIQTCCRGYFVGESGYCERESISPTGNTSTNGCGGLLTSHQGVIMSPNYPNTYPNEQNCTWQIKAPAGYKVVLKVIYLGIEEPVGVCELRNWDCYQLCKFDKIRIFDVAARKTKTLCGYLTPYRHFVSKGNVVEITFKSDISSGGKGFHIVYALTSEYALSSQHRCTGGRTWQICRYRCARSCRRYNNETSIVCYDSEQRHTTVPVSDRNELTCAPGCACPPSAPIWEGGRCIRPEACPGKFFPCGRPAIESKLKIVGGSVADKYAWPWMVQIESESGFHVCGATLICSNWVITAAHCFLDADGTGLDLSPRRYLVNIGKYWKNEQMDDRIVQTYHPEFIIKHPNYNIETDTNDIALIRMTHAVDVTDYVRPACLPHPIIPSVISESSKFATYQHPTTGTKCTVLGWGTTQNIGPTSQRLKKATIPVRRGKYCVYDSYVWKLMICAGGVKNQDTCRGDSGGPLMCKRGKNNKWFVDGVTSFGDSCGEENVSGGYTRVSNYMKWIRQYVGNKCGV